MDFTEEGFTFKVGGGEVYLEDHEVMLLLEVLGDNDLAQAIRMRRAAVPDTDEEVGVLLGVLEILRKAGSATEAMNRLHYGLRDRRP